jgi:hypothetical protein
MMTEKAAVAELIAELLDEAVPLGEMYRYVDSVRQTLSERASGIEEFVPASASATAAAARVLAERLLQPDDNEGPTCSTETRCCSTEGTWDPTSTGPASR